MFEEFRQQAEEAEYEQNPVEDQEPDAASAPELQVPIRLARPRRILGMTAPQRFIIAFMLLLEVFLIGSMFLLVTQKIVPPLFN